jgi:calcium-dependent protein kinase
VAPEVLKGEYSKECDMWSVGVITYILMTGFPPFGGKTNNDIYRNILRGKVTFYAEEWEPSPQAMDFCMKLLKLKPEKRLTAEQALKHPWVQTEVDARRTEISIDVMQRLKRFRRVDKLKKEILMVIINFIYSDSVNLKRINDAFNVLDDKHTGFIEIEELSKKLPDLANLPREKGALIEYSDFIA